MQLYYLCSLLSKLPFLASITIPLITTVLSFDHWMLAFALSVLYAFIATIITLLLAYPMAYIFVGRNPQVFDLALRGFIFYAFCFLFIGINIFANVGSR